MTNVKEQNKVTSPFDAQNDEREDRAEETDVLNVVHQLAKCFAKLPREGQPLGKLQHALNSCSWRIYVRVSFKMLILRGFEVPRMLCAYWLKSSFVHLDCTCMIKIRKFDDRALVVKWTCCSSALAVVTHALILASKTPSCVDQIPFTEIAYQSIYPDDGDKWPFKCRRGLTDWRTGSGPLNHHCLVSIEF